MSLSFAVLVHGVPCCTTMSSFCFDLPADLLPIIYHSVPLMVHLLSFIRATCLAYFHFEVVTSSAISDILVFCLMMVFCILSFSFTFSIVLSLANYLDSSFSATTLVRNHVWHPYTIVSKTHWLKTFPSRCIGSACLERVLCISQKHSFLLLFLSNLLPLVCFPLLLFVLDI